jgi:two-component system, OmpR family, phosphate regulon sensor histidine kinase PhoR
VKGWFFIGVTALLLALILRRHLSDLRRRDDRLRESEARYRLLFKANPHPMWVYDLETLRFLAVNDAAIRRYGFSRDEFLGMTVPEVSVDDLPEGESDVTRIGKHRRRDGSMIDVEITSHGLSFDRRPAEMVIASDVTERVRAEEGLKTQFAEITTIFDSINAIIYVCELETNRLLYLNRYGASLYGGEWDGKPCHEVLHGGLQLPCDYCRREGLFEEGEAKAASAWDYRNSRNGRWYQCIDRAIRWTTGRNVRMGVAIDVTEQKELERVKDEMISAVSHEMRTPLTAVLGFTELLLDNPEVPPDERCSYLETVHAESERLNDLISNFLDLQRMRSRNLPYDFAAVPVKHLLEQAAELFIYRGKGRIEVEVPDDLPPVRGDAERLDQAIANLLSNAVKYSPEGELIRLSARLDGNLVVVSVRDRGPGMPGEALEKIFERFYRIDNTDRRAFGGTGLGLAIVREVAAAHGGRVWAESAVGEGSTFSIAIPIWHSDSVRSPG